MKRVAKSAFKPRAFEYLRMVEGKSEPLVITDHGRDAVQIQPIRTDEYGASGSLEGAILTYDAPDQPLDQGDWDALQ